MKTYRKPTSKESQIKALEQAALIIEGLCAGTYTGNYLYTDTIARILKEEAAKLTQGN